MKLPRAVYRYVEYILYEYDKTLQAIEDLRSDIIEGNMGRLALYAGRKTLSDPTASHAVKLVTNATLFKATRDVIAVERALAHLTEAHRQIFELKYRRLLPWQEICDQMRISERTYYRLRRELVVIAAVEMGMRLADTWQE